MNDKNALVSRDEAERASAVLPAVDIVEDEAGITLTADIPGVSKDQLTVRMEGQSLLIEGAVVLDLPEGMEAVYAEARSPRYRRSFTLSRDLDAGKIDAALVNGVLTVRIPKAEHAQPRRITVNVA